MDFNGKKKSLYNLMNDEMNKKTESSHHHQIYEPKFQLFKDTSSTKIETKTKTTAPPSPNSPWTLSPLQNPQSPSILHHCITSLHRHEGNVYAIAVSKGVIFTGSESKKIRAWHQQDCLELGYVKASHGEVRSILSYGNLLFTSHRDQKIRLWDFKMTDSFRLKKITTLPKKGSFDPFRSNSYHHHHHHHRNQKQPNLQKKHDDFVSCMAYNHEEGILYTGSWDRTVKAWKVSEKRCIDTFLAHQDRVNAIAINPKDGCIFTCSSDGCVKIWRKAQFTRTQTIHSLIVTLEIQNSPINALTLSSSTTTTFLYSGSSNGQINFWEKEKVSSRYNHSGALQGHQFSILCLVSVENFIIGGSEDTTIRVWSRIDSGFHECVAMLDGHRGPIRCLAACLEEERIGELRFLVYSASLDQSFKVWRVRVLETWFGDHHRCEYSIAKMTNYQSSPVLSPSWVQKKLQSGK